MGFVIEKFPFGGLIVLQGPVLIIGHSKGFGASTDH